MQDRYPGDVGDFIKLGLLRAISPGRRLGVVWYKFPNEDHNNDGRHTSYLRDPHRYSMLDRDLFDHLNEVVLNARTINSLLPVLGKASSFDENIDIKAIPTRDRRAWRQAWFSRALEKVCGCNLVFADPDNGIVDNDDSRKGKATFGKQIPLDEVHALSDERCAVIYHHNTRRPGGHDVEVDHWLDQFGKPSIAVRARAYSPRTFFILNPDSEIEERVRNFCDRWKSLRVSLHKTSPR